MSKNKEISYDSLHKKGLQKKKSGFIKKNSGFITFANVTQQYFTQIFNIFTRQYSPTIFHPTIFHPTIFNPRIFHPIIFHPKYSTEQYFTRQYSTQQYFTRQYSTPPNNISPDNIPTIDGSPYKIMESTILQEIFSCLEIMLVKYENVQ